MRELLRFASFLTCVLAYLATSGQDFGYEKIHMVTDRDIYVGGDTVWFRGFVVDDAFNRPLDISRYLYVELHDPFNNVKERVKIMKRDGAYYGYLPLDSSLPTGVYMLAAYTLFSQNVGEQYFAKQPVKVLNPYSARYRINVDFEPDNSRIKTRIKLLDATSGKPAVNKKVRFVKPGVESDYAIYPGDKGYRIPHKLQGGDIFLIEFDNYREFVAVPDLNGVLDVRFAPEGGRLVRNADNMVGLHVTDRSGLGRDIDGVVVSSRGDTVAFLANMAGGYGRFMLNPKQGESYRLLSGGKSFDLPEAHDGPSLHVDTHGGTIAVSTVGNVPPGTRMTVRSHGRVVSDVPATKGAWQLQKSDLPAGIGDVCLIADTSAILAYRAFLNDRLPNIPVDIKTSTDGSDVTVNLDFGNRAAGSFAAAVLPATLSKKHVVDNFGLEGSVPRQYISGGMNDNIMLFSSDNRYTQTESNFPLEVGSEISGTVKFKHNNDGTKNVNVGVIVPGIGFGDNLDIDENGRFALRGVEIPEESCVLVRATKDNGSDERSLRIDQEDFPTVSGLLPYETVTDWSQGSADTEIRSVVAGIPSILLDEVVVTGKNPEEIFRKLSVKSFDDKYIDSMHITSLEMLLRKIPGMQIVSGYAEYKWNHVDYYVDGVKLEPVLTWGTKGSQQPVYRYMKSNNIKTWRGTGDPIIVDYEPQPKPFEELNKIAINVVEDFVPFLAIKTLDFIRAPQSFIYTGNSHNAVIITTKPDRLWPDRINREGLAILTPLGFQNEKQFSQHSDGSSTTVYWNPQTDFNDGKATLKFKKPEGTGPLQLHINGITEDGTPFSISRQIP